MPSDHYYELVVAPSLEYSVILDFILQLPVDAVEEDSGSIIIRSSDSLEDIKWAIENFSSKLSSLLKKDISLNIKLSKKSNEDWIRLYQQSIEPIEVDRFYIHPSWHEDRDGFYNIIIDPALAFGSGHHATTASCLKILSESDIVGKKLLDVGCGSGILSIASAKLGADVDMCDTDSLAVKSAKENAKINGVKIDSAWEGSVGEAKIKYDFIIANIVADVIVAIASSLKKALKTEGLLLLSGILDKYEGKVTDKFYDFKILKRVQQDEWISLLLLKEN